MRPIPVIHLVPVDIQVSQGPGTVPYKYRLNPDIAQGCFLFPKNTLLYFYKHRLNPDIAQDCFYFQKTHFYISISTG